jgi:hypothetical protein
METQHHPLFFVFGGVANENIKMPMFNDIGPMSFEYVYFGLFWSIPDVVDFCVLCSKKMGWK